MVYSTCSILKEENEGLFKARVKEFRRRTCTDRGRVDEGTSITSECDAGDAPRGTE